MPAHGSWTQSIWGWPSSTAPRPSGSETAVHTRPFASPGSTIVAPPASTASPSHSRVPSGASAMQLRSGTAGSYEQGGIASIRC